MRKISIFLTINLFLAICNIAQSACLLSDISVTSQDEDTCLGQPPSNVLELFQAANQGNEHLFSQRLAEIQNADHYAYYGRPLLTALLTPPLDLQINRSTNDKPTVAQADTPPDDTSAEDDADDAQSKWYKSRFEMTKDQYLGIKTANEKLLPAKTRMLNEALQHIVNPDIDPALFAATMYGNPEMIDILLKHGTAQSRLGGRLLEIISDKGIDIDDPLDFPALTDKRTRTQNLLHLIKGGAIDLSCNDSTDACSKINGFLMSRLIYATEGQEIFKAVQGIGMQPYADADTLLLSDAAQAGNLDALKVLLPVLPRFLGSGSYEDSVDGSESKPFDTWLDAAMIATYGKGQKYDRMLDMLITQGMPFDQQTGPDNENWSSEFSQNAEIPSLGVNGTLIEHMVNAGRSDWVKRLLKMGATLQKPSNLIYASIVYQYGDMLRTLLELGASPLDLHGEFSMLLSGRQKTTGLLARAAMSADPRLLKTMLPYVPTAQKHDLSSIYCDGLYIFTSLTPFQQLYSAGVPVPAEISGECIGSYMLAGRYDMAKFLAEHSHSITPVLYTGDKNELLDPLFAAAFYGQSDLLQLLLDKSPIPGTGPAGTTLLSYAIAGGDSKAIELVRKRTGQQPAQACLSTREIAQNLLIHPDNYQQAAALGVSPTQHCPGQRPLVIEMVLSNLCNDRPLLAEQTRLLTNLLTQAKAAGQNLDQIEKDDCDCAGTTLIQRAEAVKRQDIVDILTQAGATTIEGHLAQQSHNMNSAETRLARSLAGRYIRKDHGELKLQPDGHFTSQSFDETFPEYSTGQWWVNRQSVYLVSDHNKPQRDFQWIGSDHNAPNGKIKITVEFPKDQSAWSFDTQPVLLSDVLPRRDFTVLIATEHGQIEAQGQSTENRSHIAEVIVPATGRVQGIALLMRSQPARNWTVFNADVTGQPLLTQNSFRFAIAPKLQSGPIDTKLTIKGKRLVDDEDFISYERNDQNLSSANPSAATP